MTRTVAYPLWGFPAAGPRAFQRPRVAPPAVAWKYPGRARRHDHPGRGSPRKSIQRFDGPHSSIDGEPAAHFLVVVDFAQSQFARQSIELCKERLSTPMDEGDDCQEWSGRQSSFWLTGHSTGTFLGRAGASRWAWLKQEFGRNLHDARVARGGDHAKQPTLVDSVYDDR